MYMCICVYICVCMYVCTSACIPVQRKICFRKFGPLPSPPPGLLAPSSNILSLVELTKYRLKTKHMKILH